MHQQTLDKILIIHDKKGLIIIMDCVDCELWEKGRYDGTCIHYINNDCPYGYHDEDDNIKE